MHLQKQNIDNIMLKITQEPVEIFCNQQHGKFHGFRVSVHTNMISNLTLKAELVYVDDHKKAVKIKSRAHRKQKKEILEILEKEEFDEDGNASIFCRINDVSRNHERKLFSILLKGVDVDTQQCIAQIYTRPIQVISKKPKNKSKSGIGIDKSAVLLQSAYDILFAQSQRYPANQEIKTWLKDFLSASSGDDNNVDGIPPFRRCRQHQHPRTTPSPSHISYIPYIPRPSHHTPTQQAKDQTQLLTLEFDTDDEDFARFDMLPTTSEVVFPDAESSSSSHPPDDESSSDSQVCLSASSGDDNNVDRIPPFKRCRHHQRLDIPSPPHSPSPTPSHHTPTQQTTSLTQFLPLEFDTDDEDFVRFDMLPTTSEVVFPDAESSSPSHPVDFQDLDLDSLL